MKLLCRRAATHRELSSSGHDVDGVLFLTDVPQTLSCSSCLLRLPVRPPVLQGDAESQVLGEVVHGGVGRRLHVPEREK